ncbi:hypothetical protein AB0O28_26415 [Microbispora sp. NPDC088329]|uniref:hypothetical protein n=1 Tax=Microbispora sp. NPDC088329 TaxID=3154869 RepID=UPI0034475FC5
MKNASRFRPLPPAGAAAFAATAVFAATGLSGCQTSATAATIPTTATLPTTATAAASPAPSGGQTADDAVRRVEKAVFPLDAFGPTPEQQARLTNAVRHSMALCARRFGIQGYDDTPLPPLRDPAPRTRRYLFVDPALAARYGYYRVPLPSDKSASKGRPERMDTGLTPLEEQAVLGGGNGPKTVRGVRVPEGGCLGEANRRVMKGVPPESEWLVVRLQSQAYDRALRDPRVKAVNAEWSACMKRAGHTYPTPVEAWEDPRWRGPVDARQRATAAADMRCKLRVDYLTVRVTTEITAQRAIVKAHRPELRTFRKQLRTRLANAASMLGERP